MTEGKMAATEMILRASTSQMKAEKGDLNRNKTFYWRAPIWMQNQRSEIQMSFHYVRYSF